MCTLPPPSPKSHLIGLWRVMAPKRMLSSHKPHVIGTGSDEAREMGELHRRASALARNWHRRAIEAPRSNLLSPAA
jgi:hypothetical protein